VVSYSDLRPRKTNAKQLRVDSHSSGNSVLISIEFLLFMEGQREIVVSIRPTIEDYRRVMFGQSRKILFATLPVILILGIGFFFIAVWVFVSPTPLPKKIPALFLSSLPLLFVCLLPAVILYNVRKQSRHLAERAELSQVTFSSSSLTINSPSSTVETLLSRFVNVVETDSDFIFYPQKQAFIPIAKRFFESDADIIELRARLTSNLGEDAKVLEK
jgi:hypothetical protein